MIDVFLLLCRLRPCVLGRLHVRDEDTAWASRVVTAVGTGGRRWSARTKRRQRKEEV